MTTTIKLKSKRKGVPPIEFTFGFGETLDEMSKAWGREVVHAAALSTFRQQLNDHVRRLLSKKKGAPTPEDLQASLDAGDWAPGIRRRGKATTDKIAKLAEKLTPEERAKLVAQLKADDAEKAS